MNYVVAPLLDRLVYKDDLEFFGNEFDASEHAYEQTTDMDRYVHRPIAGLQEEISMQYVLRQNVQGQDSENENFKPQNSNEMATGNDFQFSEKNYDYVATQVKKTGVGDKLQMELLDSMKQGKREFTLTFKPDFGKEAEATLYFRLSDKGNYFFNKYDFELQQQGGPLKQSFKVTGPQKGKDEEGKETWVNSTITMKEAFNMLEGRAALKNYLDKNGTKFSSWTRLNFKETDQNGNFKVIKLPDYDLKAKLGEYHIKNMLTEKGTQDLIDSLHKGNRQAVTLEYNGNELKRNIEANPQYKTANFYDGEQRVRNVQKVGEDNGRAQDQKQGQSAKNNVADDAPVQELPRRNRKKGMAA